MQFVLLIILLLAILLVIFALQNAVQVEIAFFMWQAEMSLALVLLLCVALGGILGALFSLPGLWKKNSQLKALKTKNKKLEKELNEIKAAHLETKNPEIVKKTQELPDSTLSTDLDTDAHDNRGQGPISH